MSRPGTPEPALCVQGDSAAGTQDEDAADGTQHSHRMLSFSDALLSIIATVMVRVGPTQLRASPAPPLAQDPRLCAQAALARPPSTGLSPQHPGTRGTVSAQGVSQFPLFPQILPVTHTKISPEQVLGHSLQHLVCG